MHRTQERVVWDVYGRILNVSDGFGIFGDNRTHSMNNMTTTSTDILTDTTLDTRGLRCPEPIMMLHQAVRKAPAGQVIAMLATDPSTSWDIAKFCTHLGHTLLEQSQQDVEGRVEYFYRIQKKA